MGQVRIVTDSTADLPPELAAELGISIVPLQVAFGSETYRDGIDLTPGQFYERLASSSVLPRSSQPSVGAFEEEYDRLCRETDSIVSIHISSSLSGTFNSALLARDRFRNRANIEVIDSRLVSMGLGLAAIECARLARQGADLKTVAQHAARVLPNIHVHFIVDTLEYLQRGGRIGRAQAFLGSLLNVKPVLKIEEGEVRPVEKVRTRAKAVERLVEFVELFSDTSGIKDLCILYSTTPDDVEHILSRIAPIVPRERTLVSQVGPVVGTHVGPGVLGIAVSQGVEG